MGYLILDRITFYYQKGEFILRNLNLSVNRGEILALLGESGSGKTTLLKIIAGFLRPKEGSIIIDSKDITNLPPNKRDIGIVFQNYALFPHMSVLDNIIYGLRVRRVPRTEALREAKELINLLNLSGLENKRPTQLSGGQQQRVAIARALIIKPKILLMDEPMSNIDPKLRSKLRVEIKRILKMFGITTIYVTHDQEDAFEIGDRIAILHKGVIENIDTPKNLLYNPKTTYVASFIGYENIIPIIKIKDTLDLDTDQHTHNTHVGIRASLIKLSKEPLNSSSYITLKGRIELISHKKDKISYHVSTPIGVLEAHTHNEFDEFLREGEEVYVNINKNNLVFLK
jgi:putative spermidine/putrescine transport system ATP-binding protein